MVNGCNKPALNKLGLRLRKPGIRKAVWAPDVEAYLCREHAEAGGAFRVEYQPTGTPGVVDISVDSGGQTIANRKITIKRPAA